MKDHFASSELLKYYLVIAEDLESTKTLKNIKAIAFSYFLSHVVNLFTSFSENYQQDTRENLMN